MESIIRLLPDAIANQIAAGEVVQRPASVVKELLENAIDAGAKRIELFIKDAGKTLIQVIDDGAGMSAHDARMCFERHATSKIKEKDDLFNIRTLGFRGEALASIAAIAQVKLRTRKRWEELGTEIDIEGNEIKNQAPCSTPEGTIFQIKNLFYNVPARRNFLKSNSVETRHIVQEFLRVAIPNPHIAFTFRHNELTVFDLKEGALKDRLIALIGPDLKGELSPIEEEAGYVKIWGFIGSPRVARKTREEQFFFVNNRFIKNGLLHHAIATSYAEMIAKDKHPFYCIFLDINPIHVDINIHPTKTEVKFDDEQTLYALLQSAVKRNLGAFHSVPELDFVDNVNDEFLKKVYVPIAPVKRETTVSPSSFAPRKDYFQEKRPQSEPIKKEEWENLYRPPVTSPIENTQLLSTPLPEKELFTQASIFLKDFVLAEKEEELFVIHIRNAQARIFYERFLKKTEAQGSVPIQQLLFPQTFELAPTDKWTLLEAEEDLLKIGLEIKDFQGNTVIVYGAPPDLPTHKMKDIIEQVLADIKEIGKSQLATQLPDRFAKRLARRVAASKPLAPNEAITLAKELFQCTNPGLSPEGKTVFTVIPKSEWIGLMGE